MNKKRIGALLIGATLLVGALGSFAYFTGRTNVIGGSDDGKLQKLTITNGNVIVSGEVTNNGTDDLDWSYDVVRYSEEGLLDFINANNNNPDEDNRDNLRMEFINTHRSPDINAVSKSVINDRNTIERAEIGSALPTEIEYTRPGDAIVLGVKDAETGETGLVITNESNLTVKMQLVVKGDENSKAMIKAMNDAGWKMYVNGQEVALEGGNVIGLGVVGAGQKLEAADVRFELPLLTNNNYQDKTNVNTTLTEGLDLSQIIEIQATQENNTGWNEDGTGDRIAE